MRIEHYTEAYKADVICLIEKFHVSFLQGYDKEIYGASVLETIAQFSGEKASNAFLLIDGSKCVGLIAGIELKSYLNDNRIYSEIFWFIDEPFGMFAAWFIENVERLLKEQGFRIIVMAVLNSDKAEKVKRMYEATGYKYLESHYMKVLE
jgi:hypothetical protein